MLALPLKYASCTGARECDIAPAFGVRTLLFRPPTDNSPLMSLSRTIESIALGASASAATLGALGTPAFGASLLAALTPALSPTHLTAFRFDAGLSASVVLTASRDGGRVAERSARLQRQRPLPARNDAEGAAPDAAW